ncbi:MULTISPECIES: hypothetical protein [Streptomyces]|uniref:hypothetical protein n=1 Tax=Streptomyces TaxID=1883 RepID=UPI0004C024D9|nr:hypothetical protein [Streptomyces scopuliridis]
MAESRLPDWTNVKMGTMVRAALWLVAEVGEGNVYTRDQLQAAFPGVAQVDRRVRDLRSHGWVIATNRDDVLLAPHETRFVRAGDPVWEPGVRRAPRRQERSSELVPIRAAGPESFRIREPLYEVRRAQDPEQVWERLQNLSLSERSLLLAWIAMGRRPSSPVELAWRAYRGLSEEKRQELAAKLGELVSSELYEESPVPEDGSDEK